MALFFKMHPSLRLFVFFVIGIYLSSFCQLNDLQLFYIGLCDVCLYVLLLLSVSVFGIYQNYKFRFLFGLILAFVLIVNGFYRGQQKSIRFEDQYKTAFSGTVVDVYSKVNGNNKYQIKLNLSACQQPVIGMVTFSEELKNTKLKSGDLISGIIQVKPLKRSKIPYQFDYALYLQRQNYSLFGEIHWVDTIETPRCYAIVTALFKIREHFDLVIERSFHSHEIKSIIKALVLGDKNTIDEDLRSNYVKAGVIHVLAVSGLHVGIIYMFLSVLLVFVGNGRFSKWLKLGLGLAVLWIYAWMTHLSPSVTRATIMFSIILWGNVLARKPPLYNSLALSAAIILFIWPHNLYMPGFWLSHLAVAGIAMFYEPINNLLVFKFIGWRWMWSLISVSLSAQLTTFPIMIWLFHGMPTYFIIANVLIIPMIPWVLASSLVLMTIPLGGWFSIMLTGFVSGLVEMMNLISDSISCLPFSYVKYLSLSEFEVIAIFLFLIFLAVWIKQSNYRILSMTMFCLLVVLSSVLIRKIQVMQQSGYVFVANGKRAYLNVLNGQSNILLYEGKFNEKEINYLFSGLWSRRLLNDPVYYSVDSVVNQSGILTINNADNKLCVVRNKGKEKVEANTVFIWGGNNKYIDLNDINADCLVVKNGGLYAKSDNLKELLVQNRVVNLDSLTFFEVNY